LSGQPYRLIGVMARRFDEPRSVDVWVPLGLSPRALASPRWGNENVTVVARMVEGVSLDQANSWLRLASTRMLGDAPPVVRERIADTGWQLVARRFTDASAGPTKTPMLILLGAVGIVLLVACINIAGLMLARMTVRTRELAVRAALGASRARLLGQGVAESVILGSAGGVLGVVVAQDAVDLLIRLAPDGTMSGLQPRLDPYVLAFAAAATAAATVLFTAVSAWHISRLDLAGLANTSGRSVSNASIRQRLRSGLVVAESALALVLLMSAGVFLRSLVYLQRVDPGFDPRGVTTASFALPKNDSGSPQKQILFTRGVLERLHEDPGMLSESLGYPIPFGGGYEGASFTINGRQLRPGEPVPEAERRWVTPGYARTLGLSLERGRFLSDLDQADTEPVIVIDDKLARQYFPAGDALDQRIQTTAGDGPFRIVGIVNHVAQSTLASDSDRGVYYMSLFQRPMPIGSILVKRDGETAAAAAAIRGAVRAIAPSQALYDIKSMTALLAASLGPRRFTAQILAAFAGTSLLLAVLGLYGIVNYTVTQRNREIGIRMALGAERRSVLRLVVAEGMRLAALGLAIGVAGLLIVAPLFRRELFHVTALDPLTMGGTAVVLLSAAWLASYLPARRAVAIDPAITLRDE
jgi:predicted permease